jgi:prolyl 4-hydroxylase
MPLLRPSYIHDQSTNNPALTHKRTSTSAFLPSADPVVSCIRQRALTFQGHHTAGLLESLQVVRYTEGQRFNMHYDWGKPIEGYGDRETTFFATLLGQCERCGTHFPRLELDWSRKDRDEWCRFVECETDQKNGTVFRAFEGGAVFWRNMDDDGVGDKRNLHGGMPLASGEKIGLNIWTRQG